VVRSHGVVTETRTRILAGGVSTTRQQMLRIDRGAVGALPPGARQALARAVLTEGRKADVIIVSDYGAGVLADETRAALRTLAASGVPVCVDSRFALASFAGVTCCKPNEPELAALTGLPVKTDAELARAGARARALLGCSLLVVTRGRRGMAVFDGARTPHLIPVHGSEEAVDVTGAGDTVCATLAVALGAGLAPRAAAAIANVAGALVVQKEGTATVTRDELAGEL
jgi:rfaE bifunctional protein kinase chain/domain